MLFILHKTKRLLIAFTVFSLISTYNCFSQKDTILSNSCFLINNKSLAFVKASDVLIDNILLIGKTRKEIEVLAGKPNTECINYIENTSSIVYRPIICKTKEPCVWKVEVLFEKEIVVGSRILYD
jgi:hypothetical protein